MATGDNWSDALLCPSNKRISFPAVLESADGGIFVGMWPPHNKTDKTDETDKTDKTDRKDKKNKKDKKYSHRHDDQPGIKPRVAFIRQPEHISYAEITFTIRFTEKPGDTQVSAVRAGIRLTRQNVKALTVNPVLMTAASQGLRQSDPNLSTHIDHQLMWVLQVDFRPTPCHAFHLFTSYNYGTESDSIRALQTLFGEERQLNIYIRGIEVDQPIAALLECFELEAVQNPLAKWYPDHPTKMFIQAGAYISADERPQFSLPASPSFFSFAEYTTVLGFGLINQHEYAVQCEDELPDHDMELRLMTIPGAGNRRYLGFLECPDAVKLRIRPGDRLSVNFDPDTNVREDDWSAMAVDPLPMASLRDVSILLTRPWDSEEQAWRENGETEINAIQTEGIISLHEARQKYISSQPLIVRVRMVSSDKPFRLQINSLHIMYEERNHQLQSVLLANRFDNLPAVDLYGTITDQQRDEVIDGAKFNRRQKDAVKLLGKMPGGFAVLQGPPGTGKTYLVINCILALLAYPVQAVNQPHRILIVAPSNDTVSHIAIMLKQLVEARLPQDRQRQLVIVRCHARMTEDEVAWLPAEQKRPLAPGRRPDIYNADEVTVDLNDMLVARMVDSLHRRSTARPHSVSDPRLQHIELSLGRWMNRFAGIEDSVHADRGRWTEFRQAFDQYSRGEEMTSDDMTAFRAHTKALREHVLGNADVVVATLSAAGEAYLRSHFPADVIVVEEAAKVQEPEMWNVFAGYTAGKYILVGDQKQLGPHVPTPIAATFNEPMRLSLFTRLMLSGFPHVVLEEQHRMNPELASVVSEVFYHGELVNAPAVVPTHPTTAAVVAANGALFKNAKSLLLVDTPQARASLSGALKSYHNTGALSFTINLVGHLLLTSTLKPSDIVILTPYHSQYLQYVSSLQILQEQMPDIDVGEVQVRKIDSYQGEERPVFFLDLTITDRTGFMREAGRLNVSLSRGKYGGYIIGNVEAIEKTIQQEKHRVLKFLASVISHCKRARRVVRYSEDTTPFAHSLGPVDPESTGTGSASASGTQQVGYLTNHVVSNNNDNSNSNTAAGAADCNLAEHGTAGGTDNDTTSRTQQVGCPTDQVMQIEDWSSAW